MANADFDRERFGHYLRTIREKHNLTLRAMAQRLGVSHSGIARIESGEDAPSPRVLNAYKREFPEIPKDVEERFRRRRRVTAPTTRTQEQCLIDAEPMLTLSGDGSCTRFEMHQGITSLTDALSELQVVPLMSRADYDVANFREVQGCSLNAKPSPKQSQTHVEVFAELEPLKRLDKHDITFTFDLPPTTRQWLIIPRPSLPYWRLAPSIYLPSNRIDDIELYQVNGHPLELGFVPRFDDAASVRVYPNDNGFIRWELEELIAGNLYGVRWRSRFDALAA